MNTAAYPSQIGGMVGQMPPPQTLPPGCEVGQVQQAISSLNNSIEQACENQQAIEVRLNPVLIIIPQGKDASGGTAQTEAPVCELGENIKRIQQKVDYLMSRQRHVLQTVQL